MSNVAALVRRIEETPDCAVDRPRGLPALALGHVLPPDLKEFYELCGGAKLFGDAPYAAEILSPERCVRANPLLVGEPSEDDISASWYVVVADENANYVSIDFHPERLGRCYESFFDTHGIVGSCPFVATSFESLLRQLLDSKGERWFWMQPEFEQLGDAYD